MGLSLGKLRGRVEEWMRESGVKRVVKVGRRVVIENDGDAVDGVYGQT